ncbi:hypothetical protein EBZ80_02530 [bacterium]|nr:hypothetical protein [bacterium]
MTSIRANLKLLERSIFALTCATTILSCSGEPPKSKPSVGKPEDAKKTEAPTLISRARYEVRVFPLNDVHGCEATPGCVPDSMNNGALVLAGGEIVMETMSNFSIRFVSGKVNVLNNPALTLDLSASLNKFAPDATQDNMAGNISSDLDNRVVMTKRVGNIGFDPPRPLILGPIIQNPRQFADINKLYPDIAFTTIPGTSGPQVAGKASIRVKTVNATEQYSPRPGATFAQAPFDVLHWEMTLENAGPGSTQNVQALLLDRIGFYWRTKPIQIPRLVLDTDLASLLGGNSNSPLSQIGKIRVIMDAKEITNF